MLIPVLLSLTQHNKQVLTQNYSQRQVPKAHKLDLSFIRLADHIYC
jgi:hypothetical protein